MEKIVKPEIEIEVFESEDIVTNSKDDSVTIPKKTDEYIDDMDDVW